MAMVIRCAVAIYTAKFGIRRYPSFPKFRKCDNIVFALSAPHDGRVLSKRDAAARLSTFGPFSCYFWAYWSNCLLNF